MKARSERYAFRKLRVRRKIFGTAERPRLSVYRSLKHIYAQVVNDLESRTVVAASSLEKEIGDANGKETASAVGKVLGKRATEKGIKHVVFDRGARPYHGRIQALADGAREAGLKF